MVAVRVHAPLVFCLALLTTVALTACSQQSGGGQTGVDTATSSAAAGTGSNSEQSAAPVVTAPVTVNGGGSVSADGATLAVPAGVLTTNGTASIAQDSNGIYDLSINVPWSGQVQATIPLTSPDDLVVHDVNGAWTVESADFGDSTVWVSHLSPFTSLFNFGKKALCLKSLSWKSIVSCLIGKGIKFVSAKFAQRLAGLTNDPCFQHLIGSSVGSVALSMFTGPCVGHLDDPTVPPNTGSNGGGRTSQPNTGSPGNGSPQTSPQAPAPQEPVFMVMNTSETPPDGVWFRNSPHTADTDRVTGHGVYMNEQVQLQCYGWGDAVGQYQDRLWYRVANVTRPTNAGVPNTGWLNAHYINDGKNANVIDVGVSAC